MMRYVNYILYNVNISSPAGMLVPYERSEKTSEFLMYPFDWVTLRVSNGGKYWLYTFVH